MVRKVGKWTLDGVGVLMMTPLKNDYTLNEEAVRKQIDWSIEKGATSMWPAGYVGEWPQLDEELRKRYFGICADQAKDRAWVATGCHATNINEIIRLVNHSEKAGCDLAWICPVTPRRPTEEDLVNQYQYIIDRTSLPLAVYNSLPSGTYMTAELIMRIVSLSDRIVAVKDSVGDFVHIATVYHAGLDKKVSYFGVTFTMMPHMIWGATGVLVGPWSVPITVAAYNAFKNNVSMQARL